MPESDCFLRYRVHCNAEFYHVGKIPRVGCGLSAPVAAGTRGFKMVLFTASRGNNFVGGTCAPPTALLVYVFNVFFNFPTFYVYAFH